MEMLVGKLTHNCCPKLARDVTSRQITAGSLSTRNRQSKMSSPLAAMLMETTIEGGKKHHICSLFLPHKWLVICNKC